METCFKFPAVTGNTLECPAKVPQRYSLRRRKSITPRVGSARLADYSFAGLRGRRVLQERRQAFDAAGG
jgi:hypothetical protein